MNAKQQKVIKIFSILFFVYALSLVLLNWNTLSWMFNYKELTGLAEDSLNPSAISASSTGVYLPVQNTDGKEIPGVQTQYTDQKSQLEIPAISLSVPIVFATSTDVNQVEQDLDKGVVYYPGSVDPGQKGQIVILGHSAPPGWPKIKHDWVFTDLENLQAGDQIKVDINNVQYTYVVKDKKVIQRGADLSVSDLGTDQNILTLISCWPPGKDYDRMVVRAELLTK